MLNGIPGVLIHGRHDVSSPLETAWRLSRTWTTSGLHVLDDAGHGGGDGFTGAIVEALNRFAAGAITPDAGKLASIKPLADEGRTDTLDLPEEGKGDRSGEGTTLYLLTQRRHSSFR